MMKMKHIFIFMIMSTAVSLFGQASFSPHFKPILFDFPDYSQLISSDQREGQDSGVNAIGDFLLLKPSVLTGNDHYYDNLALFCKIEVRLEKATKFPVKFRLGEVDYVDRLEGKH